MPTYAQLSAEAVWRHERVSEPVRWLIDSLCDFYGVPRSNGGVKGDNSAGHMKGGHRSQNWIKNSRYCTNRTYTVVNGLPAHLADDVPAFDITLPHASMLRISQLADRATRSGQLEELVVWYGNTNGDQRVDGYDNVRNAVTSSDSSHLWHLHGQLDRRLTQSWEAVRKIFYALTTGEIRMGQADDRAPFMDGRLYAIAKGLDEVPRDHAAFKDFNGGEPSWLVQQVKAMRSDNQSLRAELANIHQRLAELGGVGGGGGPTLEQLRAVIREETRAAVRGQLDDDPST